MDQRQIQHLRKIIRDIQEPGEEVFLVGGAVRDHILGLPIHDLDFAVKKDPELIARKLANNLKAGYYVLDDLRHTARVVIKTDSDSATTLDFAKIRGSSILEDLKSRDFTINAMAEDVNHPAHLVDPLEGKRALKNHQLQLCSPDAFKGDPIRILRAIRFSLKFHLSIDPSMLKGMKRSIPLISKTSKERQRDEFFQILALDQVSEGIGMLDDLGIIEWLFPQVLSLKEILLPTPSTDSVWTHTLKVITSLDKIRVWIKAPSSMKEKDDVLGKAFGKILNKFLPELHGYLSASVVADRNRDSLLAFASLLHDVGVKSSISDDWDGSTHFYYLEKISADFAGEFAAGFALGNREQEFIRQVILYHALPETLGSSVYPLDNRAIYRFFKTTGDAGVGVCLLSLADSMAVHNFSVPIEIWKEQLAIAKALFNAWWDESKETIHVKPLLTGDDLKKHFSIKEGPRIGNLLESLKEEQASGAIRTRAKALTFIQHCIESGNENK